MKYNFSDFTNKIAESIPSRLEIRSPLLVGLLLVLCLGMNVAVRLLPAQLSGLRQQAVRNITSQYLEEQAQRHEQEEARAQVMETLISTEEQIRKHSQDFGRKVQEEFLKLKDPYQDETGLTYLLEVDPYTLARKTENLIKTGMLGDGLKQGVEEYDSQILAPDGPQHFFFHLNTTLYKLIRFFVPNLTLPSFFFFIPVFYSFIFLLAFYLIVRTYFSDLTAFLSVFMMGFSPIVLHRSCAGWYDTDALNLMFPLLVVGCLAEALRDPSRILRLVFYSVAGGIGAAIYFYHWLGAGFILVLMVLFFLIQVVLRIFARHDPAPSSWKPYFFAGLIFFITVSWLGEILTGKNIWGTLGGMFGSFVLQARSIQDIWPETFWTVSELAPASLQQIAEHMYGPFIFFPTLIVSLTVLARERNTERGNFVWMMFCWMIIMIKMSLDGYRFILFLSVPIFLFWAVFFFEYLPGWFRKWMNGWIRVVAFLIYLVVFVFLMRNVYVSGEDLAQRIRPDMTDPWQKALTYLDHHTPKGSILNSWWDFGSWFLYYGKRGVIFDPQTQRGPKAYWMARFLLEKDETKAVNILKMLNHGNCIFFMMKKRIPDPFLRVNVLETLISGQKATARDVLKGYGFTMDEIREIFEKLYAKPGPAYFIVDRSLVAKMIPISFLGNWDFKKFLLDQNKKRPREEVLSKLQVAFGLAEEDYEKLSDTWAKLLKNFGRREAFSRKFAFASDSVQGQKGEDLVRFDNGVVFNDRSLETLYYSSIDSRFLIPKRAVVWRDGVRIESLGDKKESRQSVLISIRGDKFMSVIGSDELIDSMFVKLYFLGGAGVEDFKPFYMDDENNIYVYQVDWSEL